MGLGERSPEDAVPAAADFERAGLLDGVTEPRQRAARIQLLEQLVGEGVTMDELKEAVANDRLVLVPLELLFSADARYTVREALAQTGVAEDVVRRDYAALGLPRPDLDDRCITESDLQQLRMLKLLLDAGLPEERLQRLARVFGRGAAQGARVIVEQLLETFLRSGDTERDLALRLADVTRELLPTVAPLSARPLSLHLRELLRHEAIGDAERRAGRLPGARDIAVSFADLTGFTALSAQLGTAELAHLVERFGALAAQAARPPVQLIKLIGDAAMLVGPDARGVVAAAHELLRQAQEDADLPDVRAGVAYGAAVNRAGDWYGSTVNLASRLTDGARPGTLIATEVVAARTGDEYRWRKLGARRFRGLGGDVAVLELDMTTEPRRAEVS